MKKTTGIHIINPLESRRSANYWIFLVLKEINNDKFFKINQYPKFRYIVTVDLNEWWLTNFKNEIKGIIIVEYYQAVPAFCQNFDIEIEYQ